MADYSTEFLRVSEPSPHVYLVELNRKPVNIFNEQFWTEYGRVFDRLSAEADVRAIVLASAFSKAFAAGIDLTALQGIADYDSEPARAAFAVRKHLTDFQNCIAAPERCPVPVIVACNGPILGLGFDIIAACDIRYAASDTIFSIKEVDVGLAADIGSLAHLPKISGNASLARELAYTARNFSAAEALQLGLVSRVVDGGRDAVVSATLELARVIASKSPVAVAGTKRLLLHSRDHSVEENMEYTRVWNAAMLQTADLGESIQAQMARPRRLAKYRSLRGASKL